MTVKEFILNSEINSIDFEICEEETKTMLYDRAWESPKELIMILDYEITRFYCSPNCFRLYVKCAKTKK